MLADSVLWWFTLRVELQENTLGGFVVTGKDKKKRCTGGYTQKRHKKTQKHEYKEVK